MKRKTEALDNSQSMSTSTSHNTRSQLSRKQILDKLYAANPSAAVFSVVPGYLPSPTSLPSPPLSSSLPVISPVSTSIDISTSTASSDSSSPLDLPLILTNLYDPQLRHSSDDHIKAACEEAFKKLTVSQNQADNVFNVTCKQAECTEWFEY